MLIKTTDGGTIATIEGTFEDAYQLAVYLWDRAGNPDVHMDGLVIVDDDEEHSEPVEVLTINYTTHER